MNERALGRTGASRKPRAGGVQPGSRVADRTCVEQAENELGGSLLCSKVTMARLARVTHEAACGCRRTPRRGASHAGREGQLLDKRDTPRFSAAASCLLENCRACPGLWCSLSQLCPFCFPFLTLLHVTCSPLTRVAAGLGHSM